MVAPAPLVALYAYSINVLHGAAVDQPVYLDAGHLVQRHHLRGRYGVAAAAPAADLDNFRDARQSADWLSLYANTIIFTFGTFFVQLFTITTAGYVFACHEFRGKQTLFLLFWCS